MAQILLFMQLFPKIFDGMANNVDSDQTALSGAVWSGSALFCICHFVRHFDVQNFRTFTILKDIFHNVAPMGTTKDTLIL